MSTRRTRKFGAAFSKAAAPVAAPKSSQKKPRTAPPKPAPKSANKKAKKKEEDDGKEEAIMVMIKPRTTAEGKDKVVLLSEGIVTSVDGGDNGDDTDSDNDEDQLVFVDEGAVAVANEDSSDDDDDDDDDDEFEFGALDDENDDDDEGTGMLALAQRLWLAQHRRVVYELAAVLGGTAVAFFLFREDMRAFGLCVLLGMVYMVRSCPDQDCSLLTAAVAGAIGVGTEQWGCSNRFWNWVAPEFQPTFNDAPLKSVLMLDVMPRFLFSSSSSSSSSSSLPWPLAGSEGFPLEVVIAYAGAGWWMGSIATRLLKRELASEKAAAIASTLKRGQKGKGGGSGGSGGLLLRRLLAPTLPVGLLQLACVAVLAVERPWQQSALMATLGVTCVNKRTANRRTLKTFLIIYCDCAILHPFITICLASPIFLPLHKTITPTLTHPLTLITHPLFFFFSSLTHTLHAHIEGCC